LFFELEFDLGLQLETTWQIVFPFLLWISSKVVLLAIKLLDYVAKLHTRYNKNKRANKPPNIC